MTAARTKWLLAAAGALLLARVWALLGGDEGKADLVEALPSQSQPIFAQAPTPRVATANDASSQPWDEPASSLDAFLVRGAGSPNPKLAREQAPPVPPAETAQRPELSSLPEQPVPRVEVPLVIIGALQDDQGWAMFVAADSGLVMVRAGDSVSGQYLIKSTGAQGMTVVHELTGREHWLAWSGSTTTTSP